MQGRRHDHVVRRQKGQKRQQGYTGRLGSASPASSSYRLPSPCRAILLSWSSADCRSFACVPLDRDKMRCCLACLSCFVKFVMHLVFTAFLSLTPFVSSATRDIFVFSFMCARFCSIGRFQLAWDPEPCPQTVKAANSSCISCPHVSMLFQCSRCSPCARLLFLFCFASSFCGITRSSMHEPGKSLEKEGRRGETKINEGPPESL